MLEYRSFERDTTFDYSAGSGYIPRKSNAVPAIIDNKCASEPPTSVVGANCARA